MKWKKVGTISYGIYRCPKCDFLIKVRDDANAKAYFCPKCNGRYEFES